MSNSGILIKLVTKLWLVTFADFRKSTGVKVNATRNDINIEDTIVKANSCKILPISPSIKIHGI